MSKELFEQRIAGLKMSEGDRKWFPKWLAGYASHASAAAGKALVVEKAMVIAFLKSLRDNHVPGWRRLQATRAIE